ncbi:Tat pathway signal sequence domain protein [Ancylostoma caninum]|uniref:Tat pathway signal sequence domain protein n=1 Tax=Ancylostoma caninum TaxID=29170 RepID=A0A368G7B4_ANCCA|nr:Tat pathway signal sequence domain protein [Ancylostoma caninum]
MLTTLATVLVPFAAHNSLNAFLLLRFLQGVACAACMPTVGAVTSAWASLRQHGLFMSALTTFGQLSAVFAMPVSGELCSSSLGWEAVFYLHAVISLVSFVGWFFLYSNSPEHHRLVSKHELAEINDGKSAASLKAEDHKESIPYLEIMTTPSVWGVWIGALGDLIAVQLIHTFSPLYIREVLQYSVHHTGFAAAIPVLFQFFVKVFAGHSSDQIRGVSETTKIRIFNSVALGASAVFLCALAFVRKGDSVIGIVFITLATAMFGFNGGGFNKVSSTCSKWA